MRLLTDRHPCTGKGIISNIGAEVDRIEAEIQELVPGVRYVDLETDRGQWVDKATGRLMKRVAEGDQRHGQVAASDDELR